MAVIIGNIFGGPIILKRALMSAASEEMEKERRSAELVAERSPVPQGEILERMER